MQKKIKDIIFKHLKKLQAELCNRFADLPNTITKFKLANNPLDGDVKIDHLSIIVH